MIRSGDGDTRGIIDPSAGFERFTLTRHEPGADLGWAVEFYWMVRWDLRGHPHYEQRVIPHPAVHLVFEGGRAEVESISPRIFVRRLEDRGQVFGVKFRPASFRPFIAGAVADTAGRRIPAPEVFGDRVDELARTLDAADDVRDLVGLVDRFLRSLGVEPLPMTGPLNAIVGHIQDDRTIVRVGDLATRLGTTDRQLQRLFAEHVGLGPKWVIKRCRVHEAVERATRSPEVDWADLAAQLGYADQSHLVRDFTAAVGTSPGRYAKRASAPGRADRSSAPGRADREGPNGASLLP